MAVGAAVAGVVVGLLGMSAADRAAREAREARDLQGKQIRQTTEEEIRRKQYTHGRDISSIEAEIAASGVSSTGEGLRGGEARTTTSVDSEHSRLTNYAAELQQRYDREKSVFDGDIDKGVHEYTPNFQLSKEMQENSEKLTAISEQRDAELAVSWNVDGGIFAEYLGERERVHFSEISWMRKTGLSSVQASMAEGSAAVTAAEAARTRSFGQVATSTANWWQASQTPTNTTTTQQTTG